MLRIRNFKPGDKYSVLQLQKRALVAINAWKGDGPWDNDLIEIHSLYDGTVGELLVGELDDRIVAIGAYFVVSSTDAEIRRMRVEPKYQGKGYATEIYHELEKRAKQRGIKRLFLDTGETQLSAINLYKKLGFKEFDRKAIWGMKCILFEKYI